METQSEYSQQLVKELADMMFQLPKITQELSMLIQ